MVRLLSSVLALISLFQLCAANARLSCSRILTRLLNADSVCPAATHQEIYSSIFNQCIISITENEIPCEIKNFVAMQPSLFSDKFHSESLFGKAVFEKLINPCLVKAQVEFSISLNSFFLISLTWHFSYTDSWLLVVVAVKRMDSAKFV